MKRARTVRPKKLRRNPHARVLASALFRPRIVKGPGTYVRRPKHRKPAATEDETGA